MEHIPPPVKLIAIPTVPNGPLTPTIPRPMTPAFPIAIPRPMVPTVTVIIPTPMVPTVTVPRPMTPTFPITVPRPMVPTVAVPRPMVPTVTVAIPKPMVPTVAVTVPKPMTPTYIAIPRPMVPTVAVTVPKPMTPTFPIAIPRPIVPTVAVPRPMTPTFPIAIPRPGAPVMTTLTMIPKPPGPVTVMQVPVAHKPTTPKPITPKVTIPRPALTMFSPEMIDENTIIALANTFSQGMFSDLLKMLGEYYHNDVSLVSDEIYDELIDIYEAKYGAYTVVGAEPTGEKVALPYYLGSLRKLKKDTEITTWLGPHPGPYLIEDKIDGLTLLLTSSTVSGQRITKLYTRGGGFRGVDVSHLLGHMRLPVINEDISVRGEVVMTKETFIRVGAGFKNARNLVSGIVIAKKQFNPAMARELSFYAYRIMDSTDTPSNQITRLMTLGFLVPNPVSAPHLTKEILENYFTTREGQAPYKMDGLVIYQDISEPYPIGEAPRHVVAFKTGTETGVTTVINVTWEGSKDRLLKPTVHYETINLSGADLQRASGYNARFIVVNNIGPGARILLTRSGDVIPKILSVISPAPGGPALPDPNVIGGYKWNNNQVEFVLDQDNDEVIANKLHHFLVTLDIKNTGPARVKAFVNAGIKDIYTLLMVTPIQLAGIPGIGGTLSNQIYNDLHERITNVPLAKIMDASGIFPHIGERRFEAILEVHPNLLDWAYTDPAVVANYIRGVKGFNALADDVANKLPIFADWLKQHPMIIIEQPELNIVEPETEFLAQFTKLTIQPTQIPARLIVQPVQLVQPAARLIVQPTTIQTLAGATVVFSGFRDKNLEAAVKQRGGKVTTAISRNTTFLVMKDVTDLKGKGLKAQELGVTLVSREQFEAQYIV